MQMRRTWPQRTYSVLLTLIALTAAPCSWADPIDVFEEFFFREIRTFQNGVPSFTSSTLDTIVMGANVSAAGTSSPPPGNTTMVATNSNTLESFDIPAFPQALFPLEFNERISYTDARGLGSWKLEVVNESTTTNTVITAPRAPIGTVPPPPFVADVEVVRRGDEMVVTWALPDGVGAATQIRPRLHAPDGEIVLQEPLPTSATSWTFPTTFAEEPGQFGVRVQVEQNLAFAPFVRRASTWFLFNGGEAISDGTFSGGLGGWEVTGNGTSDVIEFPAGSGNSLLSLAIDNPGSGEPVILSQLIDTPPIVPSTGIPGFVIRFDHLFLTDTGMLELLLDGVLLDTISATASFSVGEPLRKSVVVTDLALANLSDVLLEFRLFPGSESSVLLDDISLTPMTAVPEPTTLLLLGLGLAGLGFARKRLH